jgi:two-component system, OmpR family, KDP operon response regulator KdpE
VQLRRLLRVSLEANGYKVYEAANGQQGLSEVAARHPDLVVLDLGLPDMDGVDVLLRLREWSSVPIIVLSVREGEHDKVTALRSGADDYLTKPFSTAELLARLQVAQRHAQPAAEETVFASGPLTVDLASRSVKVNGKPVKLTRTEYACCASLSAMPARSSPIPKSWNRSGDRATARKPTTCTSI